MPNTPAQFPNYDLPGAEWLTLSPNANIAIQGRRRKEFPLVAGSGPAPITITQVMNQSPGEFVWLTPQTNPYWLAQDQVLRVRDGTFEIAQPAQPGAGNLNVYVSTLTAPSTPVVPGDLAYYVSGPIDPSFLAQQTPPAGSLVLEYNFLPTSGIYIHFFWLAGTFTSSQAGLSLASNANDYPLGNSIVPTDRDRLVIGRDIFSPPGTNLRLVANASAGPAIARIIYTRLDGFLE